MGSSFARTVFTAIAVLGFFSAVASAVILIEAINDPAARRLSGHLGWGACAAIVSYAACWWAEKSVALAAACSMTALSLLGIIIAFGTPWRWTATFACGAFAAILALTVLSTAAEALKERRLARR